MATDENMRKIECDNELKDEAKTGESKPPATENPLCIIVIGMAGSGKTTFVQVCLVEVMFECV